jgi:hypothetical protein
VFIETKIWISDYGYDEALHGFDKSVRKLGVDQLDLLILHQALPVGVRAARSGAYRALETLLAEGTGAGDRGQQLHARRTWGGCWHEVAKSCRRSTRSRCTRTSSRPFPAVSCKSPSTAS